MKIGLALGGGGAKGLAHIEFLKVFDELGVKPNMIVGTSMGALIGSLYASGKSAQYLDILATNFHRMDFFKMTDISLSKKGLVKGKKISNWIQKELAVSKFKELNIPMKIIATDFTNAKPVVMKRGDLLTAIRASIAVPGIFEPVQIKGRTLVDGGIFNQLPFEALKHHKIAIDVTNNISPPENPTIYENVMNCFYMMSNEMNKAKKQKPDILVQPDLSKIGLLEFHKYKEVKKAVASDVKKFRKQLKKIID